MANFLPLKNYIFYCVDKLIDQNSVQPDFLDVGCGIGDLSNHLGLKGWSGKAIDFSAQAFSQAQKNLEKFESIKVEHKTLFEENGIYNSIFLLDVLEHIKDDKAALEKISSLLAPGGQVIMVVPSNPREWRWDDDFYGHYRRYTADEINKKMTQVGLKPLVIWDITYPLFWFLRRLYTKIIKSKNSDKSQIDKTSNSSLANAWGFSKLSDFFSQGLFVWRLIYKIQFIFFRHKINNGHEIIILAQKPKH
ncbi:MAG: class I SAM-dependent methyltransferase [Candidatus Buchananbacteria bacterium]